MLYVHAVTFLCITSDEVMEKFKMFFIQEGIRMERIRERYMVKERLYKLFSYFQRRSIGKIQDVC